MRIAMVSATFPPYLAGTGNVCFHNAVEVARLGHEVHVFTAGDGNAPETELIDGITVHRLLPLLRVGNAPLLSSLFKELRGFDLIHLHVPFISGAEVARMAASFYQIPLIVTFHNDLLGDGLRRHLFSVYQRLSTSIVMRSARRICTVSMDHFESSEVRRLLGDRCPQLTELPNGVNTQAFNQHGPLYDLSQAGVRPGQRTVLFVAALDRAHHFKGLDRLMHAMQQLPSNVVLLVAGDGDLRERYEAMADDLDVRERCIFLGGVGHEKLPTLFRAVDLTVLPSSPPESFGLVLIESMACGTPVVASNIPGVRTVVHHRVDGLLVDSTRPTELAAAVAEVLSNDALRDSMGRCGREKVAARYDWKRIGEQLERVYGEVRAEAHTTSRDAGLERT